MATLGTQVAPKERHQEVLDFRGVGSLRVGSSHIYRLLLWDEPAVAAPTSRNSRTSQCRSFRPCGRGATLGTQVAPKERRREVLDFRGVGCLRVGSSHMYRLLLWDEPALAAPTSRNSRTSWCRSFRSCGRGATLGTQVRSRYEELAPEGSETQSSRSIH